MKKLFALLVALSLLLTFACAASAETDYPSHDITLLIPYGAGGGTDAVARQFALGLEEKLGVSVVCQNMTGGSGMVAAGYLMGCEPDGYTLDFGTTELVILPASGQTDDSITHKKLEPIAMINADPAIIAVRAESSYETLDDLCEAAKQAPYTISLGGYNGGVGYSEIPIHYVEMENGVEFLPVSFNDSGASGAIAALLGGHVEAITVTLPEAAPQINEGAFRALVVASEERNENFPDIPTFKELGYDTVGVTWRGLFAPKGIPDEVKQILAEACDEIVHSDAFVEFMDNAGYVINYKNTDEFNTFLDEQYALSEEMAEKFLSN